MLQGVRGPADRTGIAGRIDHMAYDARTARLFVACVANGTLEAIDLESGSRVGTVRGLKEPQGVAVAGGAVYVATGADGRVNRFDARSLEARGSAPVGDDADNVRLAPDGQLWVSFGGDGPGGLAAFDPATMASGRRLDLPRMPEGFQIHASGRAIYANLPAGKRSTKDGSVVGLALPAGGRLWERTFSGRAGNFPMTLDSDHERVFVASRAPARLICLSARDGSILGEAECPPQSDDLSFDARSGLVAVIGGGSLPTPTDPGGTEASLDLFAIDAAGRPARVSGTPLPPHSRTGRLVEDRRAIYVGVPMAQDRPAEVREYRLPDRSATP
jgi:DNA-binding beta-propeller fold protein YncE